jgi:hypothetical protein
MNQPSPPTLQSQTDTPIRPYRIVLAALLAPWAAPGLIIIAATLRTSLAVQFRSAHVAGMGALPAYAGLLLVGLPFVSFPSQVTPSGPREADVALPPQLPSK